jgi:hypothetical protein
MYPYCYMRSRNFQHYLQVLGVLSTAKPNGVGIYATASLVITRTAIMVKMGVIRPPALW